MKICINIMKRSKLLFLLLIILTNTTCGKSGDSSSGGQGEGNSSNYITQNGITWYFKDPVVSGKFVNGDPWVVGPVTVIAVDPAPTDSNGHSINGSMINPANGVQAYDSRAETYDDSYLVSYPVTIDYDASLVSTISRDGSIDNVQYALYAASVLTVLISAPPDGSFRPGIIGTSKKLYNFNNIKWDRLPNLTPISLCPSTETIAADYERWLERPWLLHNSGWHYRGITAEMNSPTYHQWIAKLLSHSAVLCITNWGDRKVLLRNFIQVAIDYYAMQSNSGTGAYNYRWPTIFAGIMLDDDEMRYMWRDKTYHTPGYSDDNLYTYDSRTRTKLSDILPAGQGWTGATILWRVISGDTGEHELLAPTEWSWIEDAGYDGGGDKQEIYRRMHSQQMVGFAFCASVFNAEEELDYDLFIPYVDRWMSETPELMSSLGVPVTDHPVQTSGSDFVDEMWTTYRNSY